MAIITLLKDWTSGQGKDLKPGDTIDINRDTYKQLVADGICEALNNDWDEAPAKKKKVKKENKKIEEDGAN